jgi:MFS family permease
LTALVLARLGTLRRQGRLVVASVAVFGVATAAFGVSTVYWISLLMLATLGAADTVSTVLRQTIRQLVTPNHLRGRMTSINMMFFMGGPQLGELEAGSLAAVIGAPLSVVVGGVGALICAALAAVKSKSLMEFEI